MKKILFTTLLTTVFYNNALAKDCDCCSKKAQHSSLYLKLDLLGNKFASSKVENMKFKHRNTDFGLDYGVGYFVTPMIRIEGLYNHNFLTKLKAADLSNIKIKNQAFILQAAMDLVNINDFKFFVGGGAIMSHYTINAKIAQKLSGEKKGWTKGYIVNTGVSMDIVNNVVMEAAWSWRDYGKTKNLTNASKSGLRMKSQTISLGLRFDI